jgi:hypothetical protein
MGAIIEPYCPNGHHDGLRHNSHYKAILCGLVTCNCTKNFLTSTEDKPMNAIKKARKFIEKDPASPAAQTLSSLVLALGSKRVFPIADIYELDLDRFNLAMEILQEWRLDRYYAGKAKLFDISMQTADLQQPQQ